MLNQQDGSLVSIPCVDVTALLASLVIHPVESCWAGDTISTGLRVIHMEGCRECLVIRDTGRSIPVGLGCTRGGEGRPDRMFSGGLSSSPYILRMQSRPRNGGYNVVEGGWCGDVVRTQGTQLLEPVGDRRRPLPSGTPVELIHRNGGSEGMISSDYGVQD
ncbi:hypothetical protein BJX96DRAFT_67809 [Aspergillus floccosus]